MTITIFHRLRLAASCLLGLTGFALVWTGSGLSDYLELQPEAVAESGPHALYAPPRHLPGKAQATLLETTVDSAALSFSGVLAEQADMENKAAPDLLGPAMTTLTMGLGGEVYFTLWHGTTMVHSPFVPDASDMDFAGSLDERGQPFVRDMADAAARGGGFVTVSLPRQFSDSGVNQVFPSSAHAVTPDQSADLLIESITRSGGHGANAKAPACVVRGEVTDLPYGMAKALRGMPDYCPIENSFTAPCAATQAPPEPDLAPVEQIVYVRRIPGSVFHIAAFMPLDGRARQGFSASWSAPAEEGREQEYRKGMCLSGFSLAGLAGLMLTPGRAKRGGKEDFKSEEDFKES